MMRRIIKPVFLAMFPKPPIKLNTVQILLEPRLYSSSQLFCGDYCTSADFYLFFTACWNQFLVINLQHVTTSHGERGL